MPAGPKRRATFIVARPGLSCKSRTKLLNFDGRNAFELLLDRLGLVLGRALLQWLGRAIDQVLGFLQAERSDFADSLDGVDFVRAGILEDDLKLGLFLSCRSRCRAAAAGHHDRCRRRCRDAEALFK